MYEKTVFILLLICYFDVQERVQCDTMKSCNELSILEDNTFGHKILNN